MNLSFVRYWIFNPDQNQNNNEQKRQRTTSNLGNSTLLLQHTIAPQKVKHIASDKQTTVHIIGMIEESRLLIDEYQLPNIIITSTHSSLKHEFPHVIFDRNRIGQNHAKSEEKSCPLGSQAPCHEK